MLLEGVFEQRRFLDLVRHFVVFEDRGSGAVVKKIAGYHQFHAVNVAVEETLAWRASRTDHRDGRPPGRYDAGERPGGDPGDRRVGVVWHTQGSGKSLTMAFYAGRVIARTRRWQNPTLVVLTDRNDLDDQLFGTFARCQRPAAPGAGAGRRPRADLRQAARSRARAASSSRRSRSSCPTRRATATRSSPTGATSSSSPTRRTAASTTSIGRLRPRTCATRCPNASFIGFTGTPIEQTDANTRAVFGDYIDVYDIQRAVEDGATVPIYYESRLAKLELDEIGAAEDRRRSSRRSTEGEEVERKEKLKTKWAQLEALVGAEKRVELVAQRPRRPLRAAAATRWTARR